MSGFWGLDTFPYASGVNLLNTLVPSMIISVAVGLCVGIVFDLRTFKLK
jgi:hypothetical protein